MRWHNWLGVGAMTAVAAMARPASAQSGLRAAFSVGAFGPLTLIAPENPIGLGVELAPEWRSASGWGVGLGFRYVAYGSMVPDHGAIHLDVRKTASGGNVRPVVGLRLGAFAGGDHGGDDPFIGLELGPMAGVELPRSPHASIQILGSALVIRGLFRDYQLLPGLQIGVVVR